MSVVMGEQADTATALATITGIASMSDRRGVVGRDGVRVTCAPMCCGQSRWAQEALPGGLVRRRRPPGADDHSLVARRGIRLGGLRRVSRGRQGAPLARCGRSAGMAGGRYSCRAAGRTVA
ncbi:hypothetical protein GCM10009600_10750 [Oerskovia paurometabola]